jgi:DNA-binding CsgD family transcriptional regulator
MPSPSRKTRAAARIRHLACLDVSGPQLLPLILADLRELVAFDTAGYFSVNAQGELDASMETPEVQAVLPLYFTEHMQRCERAVARPFWDAVQTDFGPRIADQLMTVPLNEFRNSDYYNLLLRPAQIEDCVSLIPRLSRHRYTGALKLYRRSRRNVFRHEDLRGFAGLERFIALALEQREGMAQPDSDTRDDVMMVARPDGRLQWLSPRAAALLGLAFGGDGRPPLHLPERLMPLLRGLQHLLRGDDDVEAPLYELENPHGHFSFRAQLLRQDQGPDTAIGIRAVRRTPRSMKLLQGLRRLDLPPRQAETCFWLARGLSEREVADRLRISPHTVVSHRRQLYLRLDVGSRQDLSERLLQAANDGGAPSP